MMQVQTPDGLLNTVVFGSGPRNFLAHGAGPAGWEAWLLPIQGLSAAGWRAASYDHRGSGSSVFAEDKITATALVDDIFRVMDALGFDRCVLAGESMGSVVAMLAAQRHPERFEGLLLCSPPPFVSEAAKSLWEGWEADLHGFSRTFVDICMPEPDSQHLSTWALDVFTKGSAAKGHRVMRAMFDAGAEGIPTLAEIRVPAVIVSGGADVITPPAINQMVADGLPNAKLVTIDEMGHFPTITRADRLVELVDDTL